MKYRAKRIRKGHYEYRGFEIECVGYFEPEKRVCWECVDPKDGCAFGHSYTLKDCKSEIDRELERGQNEKSKT